ncbi:Transcriptional regulator cudA [Entamoeba marina]
MESTSSRQGDFVVTCQHKLPKEERSDNEGGSKEVHVVIKQSSFIVVLTAESMNLEGCSVDCTLAYDNETLAPVHYINQKPLAYSIQTTSSTIITCDIRILVLSSQHEDMLFKVIFNVLNPSNETIATLYSFPIRVISKADGKKKTTAKPPRMPASVKQENNNSKQKLVQPHSQNIPSYPNTANDHLSYPINTTQSTDQNDESILSTLQYQQSILRDLTQQTNANPLSGPLLGMINSYQQLPQNQRIPQLLRIVTSLSPQESSMITELVQIISTMNSQEINSPQQNVVQPNQPQQPPPQQQYQQNQYQHPQQTYPPSYEQPSFDQQYQQNPQQPYQQNTSQQTFQQNNPNNATTQQYQQQQQQLSPRPQYINSSSIQQTTYSNPPQESTSPPSYSFNPDNSFFQDNS